MLGSLLGNSLTDTEYKLHSGDGYTFFEIVNPEELAYTYKVHPAPFAPPWVK